MATERVERKLAAILAADIAGYSRLMGADEEGTPPRLKVHRRELIDPKIVEHRGRVAVRPRYRPRPACHQVQAGMTERGAETAGDKQIALRTGKRWRLPDTEIDFVLIKNGPRAGQYLV